MTQARPSSIHDESFNRIRRIQRILWYSRTRGAAHLSIASFLLLTQKDGGRFADDLV